LFKSFSYVYEVIRTNVFANYWSYQNFDGNFEKIVVKSCNEYENYVVHLKQQWIPKKKSLNIRSKSTHKPSHNTCLNYVPHGQADEV